MKNARLPLILGIGSLIIVAIYVNLTKKDIGPDDKKTPVSSVLN